MDGLMYNLARKQKLKAQLSQNKADPTSSSSRFIEVVLVEDDGPSGITTKLEDEVEQPCQPLRGILKSPKVRFSVDLDSPSGKSGVGPPSQSDPGTNDSDKRLKRSEVMGEPPPPPPPPPRRLPSPPPPPPDEEPRPPSLFNIDIETNEHLNQAAFKLYTKFMDELAEFVDQQAAVISMRVSVQEKRQQLRQLRDVVSQCDVKLVDYVREFMTQGLAPDSKRLRALYDAAQAARDVFGPMEAMYEPLEVGLGAEEHNLKERYAQVEGRFEQFFRLNATSTTRQSQPSKIEYDASTAPSVSEPGDVGMLYGNIVGEQIRIGQPPQRAQIEKTEVSMDSSILELRKPTEASETEELPKMQYSVGTPDDADTNKLPLELVGITGDINSRVPKSPDSETRDRRLSRTLKGVASHCSIDDIDIPNTLSEEFPTDPGLLEGDHLLLVDESVETQSRLSEYLTSFESTRDRVNRWILHQLRVSPREIYALRRQVVDVSSGVPNWAFLALDEWPNDLLGSDQSYQQGSNDNSDLVAQAPAEVQPYPDAHPGMTAFPQNKALMSSSLSNRALATTASDFPQRIPRSRYDAENNGNGSSNMMIL